MRQVVDVMIKNIPLIEKRSAANFVSTMFRRVRVSKSDLGSGSESAAKKAAGSGTV